MYATIEEVLLNLPEKITVKIGDKTQLVSKEELVKTIAPRAMGIGIPVRIPYCTNCRGIVLESDYNFLLANVDVFLYGDDELNYKPAFSDVKLLRGPGRKGYLILMTRDGEGEEEATRIAKLLEDSGPEGVTINVYRADEPSIRMV